jgi:hypothetical protein
VTASRIEDRLAALENLLNPRPDPARREAALAELAKRVNASIASLAAGRNPCNGFERALVEHGGDIAATLKTLIEHCRGKSG